MGPLIPQGILDSGWSYVIAFIIGAAFGFTLEASGFSSSRKINGVFYGYDFTVIRLFMTAVVTAMIGLLYFHYAGWIDLAEVFILPTYVNAIITGGIIMGLGFIVGGFCPGTAMSAVAIGKIDAMVFVIGSFLGIFIFAESYELIEAFHNKNYMGSLKISDFLHISDGLFALIFTVVALVAFVVVRKIEVKVNEMETTD
jgi:hypothetical protein